MRFVFLGYDFMMPVAEKLLMNGHQLMGVISFPCDQIFNFNHNCKAICQHTGASYIESRVTQSHLESLISKGTELFISAGYAYKIPPIPQKKYGINIHPSVLPYARGAMPIPHIITNQEHRAAGYTIHKLSPQFDGGDILYKQKISMDDDECVERYCAKILADAPSKTLEIIDNFATSWDNATPQDHNASTHHPLPNEDMRSLNWSKSAKDILRTSRAFGRYGCFARFAEKKWNVYACEGWVQKHEYECGTCLSLQNNMAIIAVKDGFIALKEFQEITG